MTERRTGARYGAHRTSHRSWRAKRVWARRNMDPVCHLCGNDIDLSIENYRDAQAWTLDHVIPVAVGGSNDLTNLKPAHRGCNSAKGDGTTGASRRKFLGQHDADPRENLPRSPWRSSAVSDVAAFPCANPLSPNWVAEPDRAGPLATDRRTRVYGTEPDHALYLDRYGEGHTGTFGEPDYVAWKPGERWPPTLSNTTSPD